MQCAVLSKNFSLFKVGDYIFLFNLGDIIAYTDGNEAFSIPIGMRNLYMQRFIKNCIADKATNVDLPELQSRAMESLKQALQIQM